MFNTLFCFCPAQYIFPLFTSSLPSYISSMTFHKTTQCIRLSTNHKPSAHFIDNTLFVSATLFAGFQIENDHRSIGHVRVQSCFLIFSNIRQSPCSIHDWVLSGQLYFDWVLYKHGWEFPIHEQTIPRSICHIFCNLSHLLVALTEIFAYLNPDGSFSMFRWSQKPNTWYATHHTS